MTYRSRWLGLVLIGASEIAGYAVGNATRTPTTHGPQPAANASPRPIRAVARERRQNEHTWEQFAALLASNSREADFWKIVSRLKTENIPKVIREHRAAQARAATGSEEAKRLAEIESALYYHWAESDPVAALADVSALSGAPDPQAI